MTPNQAKRAERCWTCQDQFADRAAPPSLSCWRHTSYKSGNAEARDGVAEVPVILAPRLGQEVQECAPHFTVYKELPPLSWGRGRGPGGGGGPRRVYSPFSPAAPGPGTLAGCRGVGVHSRRRPYPWQRSRPQPASSSQRQDVVRTPTSPHSQLSATRGKRAPSLLQGTAGSLHPQPLLPPALRSLPNPSAQAGPARCLSHVTRQTLTSSLVSRLRGVEQIAQRHTVRKRRATASVTSSPGGSREAAQRPRSPGPSLPPALHRTRGRWGSSISQGPSVFTRQASGRLGCLSAAHHPRLFPAWSTSSQSSWEVLGTLVASVWAGNPERGAGPFRATFAEGCGGAPPEPGKWH